MDSTHNRLFMHMSINKTAAKAQQSFTYSEHIPICISFWIKLLISYNYWFHLYHSSILNPLHINFSSALVLYISESFIIFCTLWSSVWKICPQVICICWWGKVLRLFGLSCSLSRFVCHVTLFLLRNWFNCIHYKKSSGHLSPVFQTFDCYNWQEDGRIYLNGFLAKNWLHFLCNFLS